jgi:hypothetical protein
MTCWEAKGKPDQTIWAANCSAFPAKADNFASVLGFQDKNR